MPPETARIAFTFDDGPDPWGTPVLLETLAAHSVPATFFLITARARRSPGLVREIVSAGHEIGLHADVHSPLDRQAVRPLTDRLGIARAALEQICQQSIRLHRPPSGLTSRSSLRATNRAGMRIAMWSHDPRDWDPLQPSPLEARLSDCFEPGAIVLLHDGSPRSPAQTLGTAQALAETVPLLGEMQLDPVTVSVGAAIAGQAPVDP